jgi:hypothetical protein
MSGLWMIDHALTLACKISACRYQLSPQLSALPIAIIGCVIAESEENRQRQSDQAEWNGGQSDLVMEESAMGDRHKNGDRYVDEQYSPNTR